MTGRFRLLTFLACMGLFLHSCIKEEYDLSRLETKGFSHELGAPVFQATLNIGDLVNSIDTAGIFQTNPDSLFVIYYEGALFSVTADQIIFLPDQFMNTSYTMDLGGLTTLPTLPGDTFNWQEGNSYPYTMPGGEVVDSVNLKAGTLSAAISSTFRQDIQIRATVPNLIHTVTGDTMSFLVDVDYAGAVPVAVGHFEDLADYRFDLTIGNPNEIAMDFDITVISTGENITASDRIDIEVRFEGLQFQSIYGFFGQQNVSADADTINIEAFADAGKFSGDMYVESPEIQIVVNNSFGFDASLDFTKLEGFDEGVAYPIEGSWQSDFNEISGAQVPGETVTTSYVIDNDNTSPTLSEILDNEPEKLIFAINSQSNPGLSDADNFLLDTSEFNVDLLVTLPLYGRFQDFEFRDTANLDMSDLLGQGDFVESGLFRLFVENGMPFDAGIQGYFMDSTYQILDSLFALDFGTYQDVFSSGVVDFTSDPSDPNYGRVIAPTEAMTDIVISSERIDKIQNAKYVFYKAYMISEEAENNRSVKFRPDYDIKLKLAVELEVNVEDIQLSTED